MEEQKRVLYVSSEIFPYMPQTNISTVGRFLPQGIQENGKEIRAFMPRYGLINERRNQLHEVIRLSGMNLVINDFDRPLVIKVSSISAARMQVYFIDNEDYFHRKALYSDSEGKFFPDNDERAIFFARGVLETVKKLRWKPDIVHCQGWISHFLPVFLKTVYNTDPIFADAKVVISLYNELDGIDFCKEVPAKLEREGVSAADAAILSPSDGINLAKLAVKYADGVIYGEKAMDARLKAIAKNSGLPIMQHAQVNLDNNAYVGKYNDFYDLILK